MNTLIYCRTIDEVNAALGRLDPRLARPGFL
jgi:hypothetical protein